MIAFDDVTVAVDTANGPKVLLGHVTVTLPERRIAVIGANGSGKSTLLRLVNGLIEPTAGRVEVAGLNPAKAAAAVRRHVGFVFTDPMAQLLMPTAVEDVELSLRRTVPNRAERHAQARRWLADWDLERLAETSVYDLSGGERQLLALVSVLAVEPSIIVADEPTTLLDLKNARRLKAVFAQLDQQVVIATHDLEWARQFDRVHLIDGGRVAADGAPAEAIEFYRRLVDHD